MSTKQKPVGAELLRLFSDWAAGMRLAAGEELLAREPAPRSLLGEQCPERGCRSIIVGANPDALAEHLLDHRRRCHG